MTHQEAGKLGGLKTLERQLGLCPHCKRPMVGDYFKKIGAKGGSKTAQKGSAYYSEIGKKGGRPRGKR